MRRSLKADSFVVLLAVYSATVARGAGGSIGRPLKSLSEVAALTNQEAGDSYPVDFKAQVLLASKGPDLLFVQVHEQGLFVEAPQSGFLPAAGDWVSILGHTAKGGLDPIVKAERIVVTGHEPLPAALELSDSSPSPASVSNVEAKMRVFIEGVSPTFPHSTRLLLRGRAGNVILALVAYSESCDPERLVHATAELTGVYGVIGTRGALYMENCAGVKIIKAPEVSWGQPMVAVDELLSTRSATKIGDIVRVRGQVTMLDPTRQRIYIQQKQRGIPVYVAAWSGSYQVGTSIDVLGLLNEDARQLLCITGARVRRASVKEDAVAVEAEAGRLLASSLNGTLLKVKGLVTSSRVNAGNLKLVIGEGEYAVASSIPMAAGSYRYQPQAGDSVIVSGVLDVGTDPVVLIYNVSLLARTFNDLEVVSRRPWYRRVEWGRVATVLGALTAAFVAIAVFWWRRAVKRAKEAAALARTNEVLTHCLSKLGAEADPEEAVRIALGEILAHSSAGGLRWFEYDAGSDALHIAIVLPEGHGAEDVGQDAAVAAKASWMVQRLLHSEGEAAVQQMRWADGGEWIVVHLGRELLGLIQLVDRINVSFPEAEEELLDSLSTYLAFAVHLARLVQRANLTATLEERNRIAREIHDSLTQCFTGILMQLQAAAKYAVRDDTTALACIQRAQTLARDGLREARNSVVNLVDVPDECVDLEQRIRTLLEAATGDTDLKFELRVSGVARPLGQVTTQNLVRICQEVLSNTQRYASARCIFVELTFEAERVTLTLRDDGVGFRPEEANERGFGITGMRARAARLDADFHLESDYGKGTVISVGVPYRLAVVSNG